MLYPTYSFFCFKLAALRQIKLSGHNTNFQLKQDNIKDAVVTAEDAVFLIAGEMLVLGILSVVHTNLAGDAADSSSDIPAVQLYRGLGDDIASAVTDEDFDRNGGVLFLSVCHVHKGTGDTVSHLVRVARIHFFVHS